jgi:peptidoglycan/xylan/chitin deacetylase (PgdA/CDA1 family)
MPGVIERLKGETPHRFAHVWPRVAKKFVPDLWNRLQDAGWTGAEKVAALTFDDGPTDDGTPALLDALAKWNVSATFFLIGENVHARPQQARAIQAAGHAIGNHYRRHINSLKAPRRELIREMTEGSRILEDVLGLTPKWLRPPYGALSHFVVKWSRVHRQQLVLWNDFPPDYLPWAGVPALDRVLTSRLQPGSIVCLHDNELSISQTPALMREALPRLLDEGWRFVTLPEPTWNAPVSSGVHRAELPPSIAMS